ncbi:MAG: hypothetical protein V4450_04315 [Bacteroidota bacterium]
MIRRILPAALFICIISASFAQQTNQLAPDQNPNYMISQQKYMNQKDSLLSWENTTIQSTYKAYDWREARDERRSERRLYRRQSAYYQNPFYSSPSINYGWNNYGYNSYYNNNYGWNRWGISRPYIGFRSGNWWFGF